LLYCWLQWTSSGADSIDHGRHVPPLLQMAGHGGHLELKNSKQETDQTVLTITKALAKTTNCTVRAKKSGEVRPKIFLSSGALRRIGAPHPTFKFVLAPLDTRQFIRWLIYKKCHWTDNSWRAPIPNYSAVCEMYRQQRNPQNDPCVKDHTFCITEWHAGWQNAPCAHCTCRPTNTQPKGMNWPSYIMSLPGAMAWYFMPSCLHPRVSVKFLDITQHYRH